MQLDQNYNLLAISDIYSNVTPDSDEKTIGLWKVAHANELKKTCEQNKKKYK
jgi:hypothetical protein